MTNSVTEKEEMQSTAVKVEEEGCVLVWRWESQTHV